ncbi:keratin-associated protein 19-2 [Eurosta solidaginis]|uniref:keratin-associated protein 19-2 n=1 Tax=Eurosta solidaginis TaxID=178769 RepID=UPI0035310D21
MFKMFSSTKLAIVLLWFCALIFTEISAEDSTNVKDETIEQDLASSGTSARLFNLGSLFGQNPSYGYGSGYGSGYPYGYGTDRPSTYYPTNTYSNGYYPNRYPASSSSGWSGSNYPNYAYNGGGYYGNGAGGYGTSYGTGYYPTNTGAAAGGYYPGSQGTNILGGNGGYGGYGGNGGLNQYYGYKNPLYSGQRNRGYGYYKNTDRYGLPRYDGGYNDRPYVGGRSVYGAYRGYD